MSQVEVIDPIGEGFRTYLLKLEGGDIAASARTSKAPTGGRLVSDVWTDPKHRGRGYSKDIMNVIFRAEPRPLKLRVGAYGDGKKLTNDQLKEYYNRLGFTKPEGDLLVKAAARILYGRLQAATGTETWTSRSADFVERVMAEGVQLAKQVDKQASRLPWQAPLPIGPMNDQPIVQTPWWRARPGEKSLGDVADSVAGAGKKVVQVARNLVPKFPAAPMVRGPYTPNSNRVDTVTMPWPAKQSVVRRNSDGMYELVARDGKILGTHANPRKAYGQEYAIRKSEERRAKKASLLQQPQTVDALSQLMEAKRESDRRNYKRKHSILRRLIEDNPDAFSVDSLSRGMAGITHRPTGFRLHMPGKAVPEGLRMSKTSAAVERVPQKKRRPWWLAPAGTMAAGYGVMRGTDWLVPRQAYEDIKPFADAMVGDPAMARGTDMSLRQAVNYGDDYLRLGNVAVNARVAGDTTVPDIMHKARERGSDVAGWIQKRPRMAKVLPPAAQTMISGMSEHPITGEGDLRHYREFQAGPLSAYHFSLNEYNPDWGDFNGVVQNFSAKAGIPAVTSGDAAAIRSAVRDYVNMHHRGANSLDPVEIASLTPERQADLMDGFRKYLMVKDPEMYKKEQVLSAAIGAHRSTNVAKQYGQGARTGVNIRRAGLVLGGLLMAGGGYMMVRKIQQMRTRKEEERKKKERPQLKLFPGVQAKAAGAPSKFLSRPVRAADVVVPPDIWRSVPNVPSGPIRSPVQRRAAVAPSTPYAPAGPTRSVAARKGIAGSTYPSKYITRTAVGDIRAGSMPGGASPAYATQYMPTTSRWGHSTGMEHMADASVDAGKFKADQYGGMANYMREAGKADAYAAGKGYPINNRAVAGMHAVPMTFGDPAAAGHGPVRLSFPPSARHGIYNIEDPEDAANNGLRPGVHAVATPEGLGHEIAHIAARPPADDGRGLSFARSEHPLDNQMSLTYPEAVPAELAPPGSAIQSWLYAGGAGRRLETPEQYDQWIGRAGKLTPEQMHELRMPDEVQRWLNYRNTAGGDPVDGPARLKYLDDNMRELIPALTKAPTQVAEKMAWWMRPAGIKVATYTTNAPGPMPKPMNADDWEIPKIVKTLSSIIPPRPVDAPPGTFGAPPGYATQAVAKVQANMPFGTGWTTSGHTANFMKHYSALVPPLQRQVDQSVGNAVRAYNGNPIPPLDFAMRARENYPSALTHDRVADVYEKDPVAAARMANGIFQGMNKPAPPVWTAPRPQSTMVKSQAWWLQKPANSFSRALALESIPDSVKRKFDAKAEKADGVTAEELVWYAHNIAHKVDNNLENGHGHVTPPGSEKKLEKAALTAAEVTEAGKVVPKRMSMAVRSSGNYKKGIVTWNGLRISIETPAGHWRIGKKENGKLWFTKMRDAYGYIQRHEGYDGDAVDVFLGPDLDSPWVHVVNQTDGKSNTFDEVKCVIGCHTEAEARLLYMRNHTKGWRGYRSCVRMSVEQFKNWLPKAKDGPASHSQLKAAAVRGAAPQLRGVGAQKLAAFLAPLAISAGGLGTDLITNAYTRRAADRMARALGPMPHEEKALLDLQARLRTVPVAGLRSPAYISYRDIENRVGVPLGEREPEDKRRRGMVVYDPKTTPTAYYAHELGHADVPVWARSDRFTPRALTAANVFSYFPGAAYGAWSGRPVVGAAVGALGRLIGRSPMIVEEYFAMRRANQMIDAMDVTPEEKQAHKAALMRAFLTYVIPPVASGAAVGGAAGLAGMLKGR